MSAQADEQVQDVSAADGGVAGGGAVTGKRRSVPPAELPWGGKPAGNKIGRAGASTAELNRAGQIAAAPTAGSTSTEVRGRYGPKGRTGPKQLRSERTTFRLPGLTPKTSATGAAPPEPVSSSTTTASSVNYFYATGLQFVTTTGFWANIAVAKPALDTADYHSLGEIAIQSADGNQTVEVGWIVSRQVNGDVDPHLFVYHWVNGEKTCYNCGWTQAEDTDPKKPKAAPGDTLSTGVKKFGISYNDNAWHVAVGDDWIGYFDTAEWSNKGAKFQTGGIVQAYGEVASTTTAPCSDMGNGQSASNTSAKSASIGTVTLLDTAGLKIPGTPTLLAVTADSKPIPPEYYSIREVPNVKVTGNFYYGGPGYC